MTGRILRVSAGCVLGCVLATVAGCREEAPRDLSLLTDSAYIVALAQLVHIHERTQSSRARSDSLTIWADSARRAVLVELGVTEEELLAYAKERGGEPTRMKEIWESIATQVDSLDRKPEGAQTGAGSQSDSGAALSRNPKGGSP